MFAFKGNLYSKMFIYLIKEDSIFTSKSLENKILQELIKLRIKYKIQLLVLLTHGDTYCDTVKKDDKNWKEICKKTLEDNKKKLLDYLNSEIKKYDKNNFQMQENDIRHICLVEPAAPEITEEEIIKDFDEEELEEYNSLDENGKKGYIKGIFKGKSKDQKEIKKFLKNEIKVLEQKELIEIIKKKLPVQYHIAFQSKK